MLTACSTDVLAALAADVRATAWLLPADAPLRGYLELLAALPPEEDAWIEVIAPWLDASRRGESPDLEGRAEAAALGALGVLALRAARELGPDCPAATALLHAARWCFYAVRADAH